jgi:2-polyprenyl-3-methyl-5-hydroxy-6-metoxy-1,4-benzoquinol methylase
MEAVRGAFGGHGQCMSYVSCNLCGKDDYVVLFEAGVAQRSRIVKCSHCGLMYSNPRVAEVDCEAIKSFDPQSVLDGLLGRSKWRLEKESLQVRDYSDTRKFVAGMYPERGLLVEIGSGLGYLLDFFRKDGWTAFGIEPNEGLCRYARQTLGLSVASGTLQEADLQSESADVVSMIHVIEHVPDPSAVFSEVFRVLKPGGCFVVETPRYDTLMFKLLGKRERSLNCDGHIFFFTTETLKRMAGNAGFEVLKVDYVGRSMTLGRLLYNVGVVSKSKRLQQALYAASQRWRLNHVSMTINVRDMQRLYLRKPVSAKLILQAQAAPESPATSAVAA